jgi:hypothetical protein
MVVFTMITVAGCGSPSTATPITTEHHKAIAVATMPATISSICKRTASYTFSAGYEVQKVGTEVSPSSVLSEVETYGEAFVGAKAGYALAVVNSQTYPARPLTVVSPGASMVRCCTSPPRTPGKTSPKSEPPHPTGSSSGVRETRLISVPMAATTGVRQTWAVRSSASERTLPTCGQYSDHHRYQGSPVKSRRPTSLGMAV